MKRTSAFTSFFLPVQALLVTLALLSFAPTCLAQQPSPSPAEIQAEVLETLKQLRQQVAELQQRTKELEARLGQPTAPHHGSTQAVPVAESAKVTAAVATPATVEEAVAKEEQESTPVVDHSGHGGGDAQIRVQCTRRDRLFTRR